MGARCSFLRRLEEGRRCKKGKAAAGLNNISFKLKQVCRLLFPCLLHLLLLLIQWSFCYPCGFKTKFIVTKGEAEGGRKEQRLKRNSSDMDTDIYLLLTRREGQRDREIGRDWTNKLH